MGHRTCSSVMLFVVFSQILILIQHFYVSIYRSPQKLVLAPGVTIRDNTVLDSFHNCMNSCRIYEKWSAFQVQYNIAAIFP